MTTRSLSTLSHRILPLALAAACLALLAPLQAQDKPRSAPKTSAAEVRPRPQPRPDGAYAAATPSPTPAGAEQPQEAPAPRRPAPPAPMLKNIKVDVTITDQSGAGQPVTKTVSALMGDLHDASVRTFVTVPSDQPGRPFQELPLNVDLESSIARENPSIVRVRMSLQYSTGAAARSGEKTGEASKPFVWVANLTHKIDVLLDSGKPLVVCESSDPATDRKVTIALKATVLN